MKNRKTQTPMRIYHLKCRLLTLAGVIWSSLIPFANLYSVTIQKAPYKKECCYGYSELPVATELFSFDRSEASDINDKGEVVGTVSKQGTLRAYFISTTGQLQLFSLPGTQPSGLKINNHSQVIGNLIIERNNNGTIEHRTRGFFWDPEDGLTIIESLSENANAWVRDINDRGEVVGFSETDFTNPTTKNREKHAFVWHDGKIHNLTNAECGDFSEAVSINNNGEIIGMFNYYIDINGTKKMSQKKPFYWNGTMRLIPCGNSPVAINNRGHVLLKGYNETLVWNPLTNTALSYPHTEAVDINDHAVVIFESASMGDHPPSYNEIVLCFGSALHRGISFRGSDYDECAITRFSKINNHNEIVGYGLLRNTQETHALRFYPSGPIFEK